MVLGIPRPLSKKAKLTFVVSALCVQITHHLPRGEL
jgi:hypothetical protein